MTPGRSQNLTSPNCTSSSAMSFWISSGVVDTLGDSFSFVAGGSTLFGSRYERGVARPSPICFAGVNGGRYWVGDQGGCVSAAYPRWVARWTGEWLPGTGDRVTAGDERSQRWR